MTSINPPMIDMGASLLRLETIIRIRWLAITGQTFAVLIVQWALGFNLPMAPCLGMIALSAWLNIYLTLKYPASQRLPAPAAAAMLAYDIVQLAVLLYLTGGLQNPFALLFLAPVTISAPTQPTRITLALGLLALGAATILVGFHMPLPWRPGESLTLPPVYVAGLWLALVSGLAFIGFYAWRIAREGRQMADALAATELVLEREKRLSALDGLAAAAAHELGTPLSTISVIARELQRECDHTGPWVEDLTLLKSQADRCRNILSGLTMQSPDDAHYIRMPFSQLIEEAVEPYRQFGIEISVFTGPWDGLASKKARSEPVGQRNPGLLYGLGNLIDNAVDHANTMVDIQGRWNGERVSLVIEDDGPGFSPEVIDRLGEPFVTTRGAKTGKGYAESEGAGMGLGVFIAKTLVERSGGVVGFSNRKMSVTGARIEMTWPRAAMDRLEKPEDMT